MGCTIPIFVWRCPKDGLQVERLMRSYEVAESHRQGCHTCGAIMHLAPTAPFFTQFRPFVTEAFTGQPIEVSDRRQLRNLCKTHKMKPMGDSAHGYFGSNPKSIPSWEEICKDRSGGPDPKLAKLVHAVPAKEHARLEAVAEATDFGRKSTVIPESLRGSA